MFSYKVIGILLKRKIPNKICKRCASSKVRVRFAPSPTGFLHLGGLRTALYNYLFAKSHNGVNLLRIEDTDLSRKVPSAIENLIEDLAWCGIKFNEEMIIQSERKDIYQQYVKQLLEQKDAYYCFCSTVRLDLLRREALKVGQIPRYDNCCRDLTKEEVQDNLNRGMTPCVRFKLTSFTNIIEDLIQGPKSFDIASQEGDPIILKTDGFPTYHLANVIDDHLMGITHVLRGMEWLTSVPKHVLLYKAFKWDPPQYGHIPLLLNMDGKKLSKRQGDIQVRNLREAGYLPNSLINFVIRFGGGFGFKTENKLKIYTLDELAEKFELSKIRNSSCRADIKLLPDFNQAEILRLLDSENEKEDLIQKTQTIVKNYFKDSEYESNLHLDEDRIEYILKVMKPRIKCLDSLLSEEFNYLWVWENKWNDKNETAREIIGNFLRKIETLKWDQDNLSEFVKRFAADCKGMKYGDLMQTVRFILTGSKIGPGVVEIMCTLSKEDVKFRLSKALEATSDEEEMNST